MNRYFRKIFLFLWIGFGLSSAVHAYTSTDYYNAGLKLYQDKNYSQASLYFGAAIKLDPNNISALQGRANCNYLSGQYASALTDYQTIQTLHPTDQLAQFIQRLQAQVGNTTPGAPGTASSSPGLSPMDQGKALYQSKQYQAAAPYFQQAIQQTPNDYRPYYWMAVNSVAMGDTKSAALYFTLVDRKQPNAAIKAYVQKLWALLSPADQQWVYEQEVKMSPNAPVEADNKKFGIRLEPSIVFINLADFNAEGVAGKAFFGQELNVDPNLTYTAEVPAGYLNLGIEPVLKLMPNLEIGLPLSFVPLGSFTETLTSTVFGNQTTSQSFTGFSAGLNARYFITSGDFRLFVAGGPMIMPVSDSMAVNSSAVTYTASLSSLGIGGHLQIGLDWHLDNAIITPFAGYQLVSFGPLTGTTNALSGQVTEVFNSNAGASYPLIYLTNQSLPSGWRPVQLDLSGPYGGLSISMYF